MGNMAATQTLNSPGKTGKTARTLSSDPRVWAGGTPVSTPADEGAAIAARQDEQRKRQALYEDDQLAQNEALSENALLSSTGSAPGIANNGTKQLYKLY